MSCEQDKGDAPRATKASKAKDQDSGCAALVGGTDTAGFPASVLLATKGSGQEYDFCSSTFVGPNTLITAGHCIQKDNIVGIRYIGDRAQGTTIDQLYSVGVSPLVVIHHGSTYIGKDLDVNSEPVREHDIAFLIFKDPIAKATMELAPTRPAVGATVDVVGFGMNVFAATNPTHVFRRQTGKNRLASFQEYGISSLGIKGPSNTTDSNSVLASFGDSGGALIHEGKLAGVTSMIAPLASGQGAVFFVDLSSSVSLSLVAQAKAAGAIFGAPVVTLSPAASPSPAAGDPAPAPGPSADQGDPSQDLDPGVDDEGATNDPTAKKKSSQASDCD